LPERKYVSKEEHQEYLLKYNISPRKAMFTLVLSIIVDIFGYSLVIPLLPNIIADYAGGSDLIAGLLISSNAFAALIFGPIWGRLSDKYGRKKILLISQIGTGVSFLILGFSNSLAMIVISRVTDGIFGGQIPIIRAYISDITTPETRASEMGKIMVGHTIGMITGPLISGILGFYAGWRVPAFIASSLTIIAVFLTIKVLVESMPPERVADMKKKLELEKEQNNGVKRSIWSKELVLRLIQILLAFTITGMFMSSLSFIIVERYGGDTFQIGLIMTVAGLFVVIYGGLLMKPLIKKIGEKRVLVIAIGMLIIMCLIFPYLSELWMLYVFIPLFVFSMIFMGPLLQSNITKAVDPDMQGNVSGWTTNTQSISQIIAPLIAFGYLEIGEFFILIFFLSSYQLIGFTAALIGVALFIVVVIDLRKHKYLYAYNGDNQKPSKSVDIATVEEA